MQTFAESDWSTRAPTVPSMWQRQWEQMIPFFAYPPEVRKIIYTTNAIESMHMQLRKIEMPPMRWKQAVNQFAILFGECFTSALR